jgi:hypothetical protein
MSPMASRNKEIYKSGFKDGLFLMLISFIICYDLYLAFVGG